MKKVDPIFKVKRGNHVYNVGHWGHMAYLAGSPGSGKSTHLTYAAASALKNDWVLGYKIDLQNRNVIVIDGEQPPDLYQAALQRIGDKCGGENMDRLIFPNESLASITRVADRRNEMLQLLTKHKKDLGVVLIDRIGNFVSDPNNARESESLQAKLMTIMEMTRCMMVLVCHVTMNKFATETKLFGMQGTFIKQSASWGLLTQKQSKYMGLLPDKTRYGSFPPLWAQYKSGELHEEKYCPF